MPSISFMRPASLLGWLGGAALAASIFAACGGTSSTGGEPANDAGNAATDGSTTGSDSGGAEGGGTDGGTPKDAAREANVAECPAAYSASPPGHCTIGVQCGYDEGNCVCAGYCGGAPPPPDTDFSHWQCTPKRTDGCPDVVPTAGTACPTSGKKCQYDDCCAALVTCTSGTWSTPSLTCPP